MLWYYESEQKLYTTIHFLGKCLLLQIFYLFLFFSSLLLQKQKFHAPGRRLRPIMWLFRNLRMSLNDKGIRRFASPDKGFAKQRPGLANCGWSEPWEWSEAEWPRRTEPRAAEQAAKRIPFVMRWFCSFPFHPYSLFYPLSLFF